MITCTKPLAALSATLLRTTTVMGITHMLTMGILTAATTMAAQTVVTKNGLTNPAITGTTTITTTTTVAFVMYWLRPHSRWWQLNCIRLMFRFANRHCRKVSVPVHTAAGLSHAAGLLHRRAL
jgi:hypothetical protein